MTFPDDTGKMIIKQNISALSGDAFDGIKPDS
jgi:hypothetical protein